MFSISSSTGIFCTNSFGFI